MSHRYRVLVVGTGSIGERHVRCFLDTHRAVVGIVEHRADRRREIEQTYNIRYAAESLEQALAAPTGWDAAVVCTPADQHVAQANRLLEAGTHLLIEKPLSTSLTGVEPLLRQADEQQIIVGVAYVMRHHPALTAMRQELLSGRFGRPVQVVATCGQHFPTYRPAYRDIYYADRQRGGGALQDALTHVINAAEWLVGPVQRVVADAAHQVLPDVEVEDTVHLLTRHEEVLGSFALNQYQPANEITLTVNAERAVLRFEYHRHRWRWMSDPDDPWVDVSFSCSERDVLFRRQANHFLDCLEFGAVPRCDLRSGLQTLQVHSAAFAALQSSAWQVVPELEQA